MSVERITLGRTGLEISRVGLGLANLHTISRSSDRTRLIHRALDLGITHFDTARFYSDGLSEATLGRVLAGKRRSVTIATKFGLLPTPFIGSLGVASPLFRKARSLCNKLGVIQYPSRSYTRATLQKSLRASLRALRTDYIDIYHLHEPLSDTCPTDDLFEELARKKKEGSIRFIGVSGADIDSIISRFGSSLDVIQSAESSWNESRFTPDITHSLFSGGSRQNGAKSKDDFVRESLERALIRRPNGAVVVQTRFPKHLEQIVGWAALT